MMEEVLANWISVKIQYRVIDFPKRVVQCGKTEDGSVGVDYMEKEKFIQDERNMFINVIYITTGLTMAISTCKNFVHYFCTEENDLYIKFTYSACWCINFLLPFSFFLSFFYFLVSARMWLAKRSSCRAISCSWAATRLAFHCFLF